MSFFCPLMVFSIVLFTAVCYENEKTRSSSQPVELTALSWSHYRDRFLSRDLPQRRGPLFYMYDLPREVKFLKDFWWRWPDANSSSCRGNKYVDNSHAELHGVGRPILPEQGLYLTWHFSLFTALHNRLVRSRRRTLDPEQASLFVLPYDLSMDGYLDRDTCSNKSPLRCSSGLVQRVQQLLADSPFFQRSEGRDHAVLWSLHEHHAIPRGGCDGFMKSFCRHCMFTCYWMNFSRPDNRFVSVPNPSVYHWRPDLPQLPWVDLPSRRRNLTAVYLGSTLTMTAAHTKIRRAVTAQCERSAACEWRRVFHSSTDERIGSFLAAYRQAVFCLNPPGDDPSRKGIFDSIVAGCIPVIFDVSTVYNQFPWHLSEQIALDVSVFIPGRQVVTGHINFMQVLLGISEEVIRRKQQAISILAPSLQYSIPPWHLLSNASDRTPWEPPFQDAADRVLDGMFHRAERLRTNRSTGIPVRLLRPKEWVAEYSSVRVQLPE